MQQSVGIAQVSSRTPPPPFFMSRSFPVPVRESHFHQHQGAPTGSVKQQLFDVGMAPHHALPCFMGHSNIGTVARDNYYTGGVMPIGTRPVSSSGQSIASRLRENSFGGTNFQACTMPPKYNRPIQSTYNSQLQYDPYLHVAQRPEVGVPSFHDEEMTHRHYEDTFNSDVCIGLDLAYGNAASSVYELPPGNLSGGRSTQEYSFGDYAEGSDVNIFHGGSSHFGSGHSTLLQNHYQYSAPRQHTTGHVALHHPYHHSEPLGQTGLPSNPYKNTLQETSFRTMSADVSHFGGGHANVLHNQYQHSAPQQQMAGHVTLHDSYRHTDPRNQTSFPSNPYKNNLQ